MNGNRPLEKAKDCEEAAMVGDAYRRDAGFISRCEDSQIGFVEAVRAFATTQTPISERYHAAVRTFLQGYGKYKSQVAQAACQGCSIISPVVCRSCWREGMNDNKAALTSKCRETCAMKDVNGCTLVSSCIKKAD